MIILLVNGSGYDATWLREAPGRDTPRHRDSRDSNGLDVRVTSDCATPGFTDC